MAIRLVTCRKCGKVFDYEKVDGVCPKCARYYSLTNYNEEEAMLSDIMAPANEDNCSYHGNHDRSSGLSGHSESHHKDDLVRNRTYKNKKVQLEKNKILVVVFIIYIILILLGAMR